MTRIQRHQLILGKGYRCCPLCTQLVKIIHDRETCRHLQDSRQYHWLHIDLEFDPFKHTAIFGHNIDHIFQSTI